MHSGEDKCNEGQLPERGTPFVDTTQNEFLGRKYTADQVSLDDSGDEEYFPVIYGTGGGNKRSNTASGSPDQKKSKHISQGKGKSSISEQVKDGDFARTFSSKDPREEVAYYEGIRNEATSKLNSVYDEIRPIIEVHGPDNQDSVPTSVVEKWITTSCSKYNADFDLFFSRIKNVMCPRPATDATVGPQTANAEKGAGPQKANAEEGAGPQTTTAEEGAESQTASAEEGAGPQTATAEEGVGLQTTTAEGGAE